MTNFVNVFCRAVQNKRAPEGRAGPGPLCEEAAQCQEESCAGEQHPPECTGLCVCVRGLFWFFSQ